MTRKSRRIVTYLRKRFSEVTRMKHDSQITPQSFIEACYIGLLGRQADDTGLQNHMRALLGHGDAAASLAGFIDSDEFRSLFLQKSAHKKAAESNADLLSKARPRAASGRRTQTVQIGRGKFSITSDDDYLIHVGSVFEPEMCELFTKLVRKDDVVVDIGANIGCTAILFGQLAKEVICFEPSQTTFRYLELNVSQSRLGNISSKNIGLGSKDEVLTLTMAPTNRSGAYVSNKIEGSAGSVSENITVRNGDRLLKGAQVDLVKIDVEGFEMDVLRGLARTIETAKPMVVCELNHWCLNAFQRISVPEFFDFLIEMFPRLYAYDAGQCIDLRDADKRYHVMYQHILNGKFQNVVGLFSDDQLERLTPASR